MNRNDPRPHLLYVAWGFPPARSGGVYRALATANAFAERGWRVTVLTADRETFVRGTGIDPTLEALVHPSITVERIPFASPASQTDIREWSYWRAAAPELWTAAKTRRDWKAFPERGYGAWRRPLETAARALHHRDPVDLTIATANPHVDFVAGNVLHREFGVPYVMDYRDAWQLDVFSGERVSPPGSAVDDWERRLMASATEVWFVNDPIRVWHQEVHPDAADRMHVVANGYEPSFAKRLPRVRPSRGDGLVFGYIGTISSQVPVAQLLEGWSIARQRSDLIATARLDLFGYLDHSGIPNQEVVDLVAANESEGVRHHGAVGKADIGETYAGIDALLLVLGTGVHVTSGKVFEYAATGIPIGAIHDPGNAATEVLRTSPEWFPTPDLSGGAIADTLIRLGERALAQTVPERAAAQQWATRFERTHQLEPRIEALQALSAKTRGGTV
ncbi:glycosyltransferase involved in cell wall biosynthesis [Agromyces cerinus]|uniref:glycosyltransferase n=1 Tax=Agromyces cerinus TaxID=33878 RepID=UPI0019562D9F|nr:glycosyltransferase [Agromyces cerinus]MBM7830035.1 glycosyltransferase involved in cell wall biosynthesis [Agromyces cerinus]